MHRLWQDLGFGARRLLDKTGILLTAIILLMWGTGFAQLSNKTIPLDTLNEMQSRNVKIERVTYKGRSALRVTDTAPTSVADGERLVILSKTEFQDGVIEIELTGEPAANAGGGARGFVGLAFRVSPDAAKETPKCGPG